LGRYIFKPIASAGFIIAAISYLPSSNAVESTFFTSAKDQILSKPLEYAGACLSELQRIYYDVAPTFLPSATSTTAASVTHSTYTIAMMIAFGLGFLGD
ncbi:hypothetical protein BGW41_007885, partial [Actinomortierella wolfii]